MECVRYEQQESIGLVTIDREKSLNALNSGVLDELGSVMDAIPLDIIRCVIITGAGTKAFVAGADIGEMMDMDIEKARNFGITGNALFRKIEKFPVPVIAAVNGFALGGGCELCLSCDIRIASENAVFGQPETGLGITPGFGGTQRLARTIGMGRAKELIYSCRNVKSDEALRIGLVNAVYPQESLMDESMKLASRIAGNAPIAVRQCKKAINAGMQTDIDAAVAIESELFSGCFATRDQRNAMKAFCSKKKPDPFINK